MDISSKFSLYDILAIIIPGGIIMAAVYASGYLDCHPQQIICCCGCRIIVGDDFGILQSILLLSGAYIVGLVNNWLNDGIFRGFRNYEVAIDNELLKVVRSNGNINLKLFVGNKFTNAKDSYKRLPYICYLTLKNIVTQWFPCRWDVAKHNNEAYYKAYYALLWHGKLGSVPLIESQVMLLRNSIIPSLLLIILSYDVSIMMFFSVIFVICLYIVMVQRQNRVYRLVWESANYFKI